MLSIQKLLIAYNSSARSAKAQYIIIHDVGEVSTARNNRDYFAGGDRQASADFFIDSSNIIQIIDYHSRYSWAIGDGHGEFGKTNANSVSVEMCLESNHQPSAQTIQNTLDLTHYLMKELGISASNVVRHYDCSHKCCPGSFSANNWAQWNTFKARLIANTVVTAPVINFNIRMAANIQGNGLTSTSGINSCKIGTEGQSKRLEMFSMTIDGIDFNISTHEQTIGDTATVGEGAVVGKIGMGKRIEGITINVLSIPTGYKLQYRANIQNLGLTSWMNSGIYCGTKGKGLRVESIEVQIVKL